MVLLTLGILLISIAFLAFKFSPSKWRRHRRPAIQAESAKQAAKSSGHDNSARKEMGSHKQDEPEDTESPTTPKASSFNGALKGPVPTFTVEDKHTQKTPRTARTSALDQPTRSPPNPMGPPPLPTGSSTRRKHSISLMPPPSVKPSALRPLPRLSNANGLNPPPSAASSARAPPGRLPPPSSSLSPNAATTSTLPPSRRPSRKVELPPGHSPLDWASLTRSPPSAEFLRGKGVPTSLVKVSPSQLKQRNGRKGNDAWGTWQGKVYNLTAYKDFHPGGVGELMRGAGKVGEAERLFMEIHPWVNWDGMLSECLVGILVGEGEGWGEQSGEGRMEEMD